MNAFVQALALLNSAARNSDRCDRLLDLIANEKPFDSAHYTATEAERAVWAGCAQLVEQYFRLDPGTASRALRDARLFAEPGPAGQ